MDRPGTAVTRAFSWSLPLLSGGIFGALSTLATVGDPDLFWHLAQGRQTITDGLARVDTFSWSVNGLPVLTDQWLGQVLWYEAYAALGWNGIIVLRAVLVAAIVTLILAMALHAQRRPIVATMAALPAIALTRFAWTERPQLMGLCCFAVLIFLLRMSAERPRVLIAAPALILIWANLHASFALGLAVTAIACAELWLRRPDARRVAVGVVAACIAVTLLTPSGISIWTSASGHFLSPPRVIQEEGVGRVAEVDADKFVRFIQRIGQDRYDDGFAGLAGVERYGAADSGEVRAGRRLSDPLLYVERQLYPIAEVLP